MGVQFPEKKRYVTVEWPHTGPSFCSLKISLWVDMYAIHLYVHFVIISISYYFAAHL